jgi:hypothetical protein
MRTYKLDGNKKFLMSNFTYDMATTIQDSLIQKIRLKFMFVLGEYWLDVDKGVPYFDKEDGQISIFNKSADVNTIESTLKEYLLDTEGVKEILSFSFSIDNGFRRADINFDVKTTTGETVQGEIII